MPQIRLTTVVLLANLMMWFELCFATQSWVSSIKSHPCALCGGAGDAILDPVQEFLEHIEEEYWARTVKTYKCNEINF